VLLNLLADRLLRAPIPARGHAGEHPLEHDPGERVRRWDCGGPPLGCSKRKGSFRKVIGYTDLPRLAVAIERRLHLQQPDPLTTQEVAIDPLTTQEAAIEVTV